jgi:hypothetical protein
VYFCVKKFTALRTDLFLYLSLRDPSLFLHSFGALMSVLSKLQASNCRNKRRRGRGGTKKKCLASSEESFNIELVFTSSTKHQIMKREVEKKAVPLSEDILETANRRLSGRAARLELEEQMQTKDALSRGSERDRLRDPRGRRADRHPRPHRAALSTGRIKGSSSTRPHCSPGYFTILVSTRFRVQPLFF